MEFLLSLQKSSTVTWHVSNIRTIVKDILRFSGYFYDCCECLNVTHAVSKNHKNCLKYIVRRGHQFLSKTLPILNESFGPSISEHLTIKEKNNYPKRTRDCDKRIDDWFWLCSRCKHYIHNPKCYNCGKEQEDTISDDWCKADMIPSPECEKIVLGLSSDVLCYCQYDSDPGYDTYKLIDYDKTILENKDFQKYFRDNNCRKKCLVDGLLNGMN